jgi:hypothetical protein
MHITFAKEKEMPKNARFVSILILLALGLTACNMPSDAADTESANAVLTAAAQTVEANLTQAAPAAPADQPTAAPVLPTNTTPPDVTLAVPTNTLPVATATQDCDKGDFVTDVTIPDGTVLDPDESFTKTWRLKNTGTCSWTPSYAIVFDSGDAMSGPATQALTGNVNPGQTVDISVNLKAPSADGTYRGYWKLRNAAGTLFATVYVDVKVSSGPFAVTSVTYTVSTFDENTYDDCPKVTADITTNGAGTVTYQWTRSDGATGPTESLDFAAAGTKSVEKKWYLGSGAPGSNFWLGIYIDDPNHQDFGHADVSKCTAP